VLVGGEQLVDRDAGVDDVLVVVAGVVPAAGAADRRSLRPRGARGAGVHQDVRVRMAGRTLIRPGVSGVERHARAVEVVRLDGGGVQGGIGVGGHHEARRVGHAVHVQPIGAGTRQRGEVGQADPRLRRRPFGGRRQAAAQHLAAGRVVHHRERVDRHGGHGGPLRGAGQEADLVDLDAGGGRIACGCRRIGHRGQRDGERGQQTAARRSRCLSSAHGDAPRDSADERRHGSVGRLPVGQQLFDRRHQAPRDRLVVGA
jgi:hypothetical protein